MNENSNPLYRPISAGDIVTVARSDEYGGLTGRVREIQMLGTPEHDTGNPTDDIIVDLSILDYSAEMMDEITALMNELGYEVKSYDDVSLDLIIFAPEDLIQITDDELTKYHTGLAAGLESAKKIGDTLSAKHFGEIYKAFIDRTTQNYASFERQVLDFDARVIYDMAANIHAISDAYSYLTAGHDFSEEELRFYLQFLNPLDIVAGAIKVRNMDVSDMPFSMDYLWGRRDDIIKENALFGQPVNEEKLSARHFEKICHDFLDSAKQNIEEPEASPEPLTIREQLYEKMSAEYKGFLSKTRAKPASDIIEAAYEKVFKEDLLLTIGNDTLSDEQLAALLTLDTPLADLYSNWLDTDVTYMDVLRESVEEYADAVISELAGQEKAEPADIPHEPVNQKQPPAVSKQPPSLLSEVREAARLAEARKPAQIAPPTTKPNKENEL